MKKMQVVIHIEIKADEDDPEGIKEAVYDKLTEEIESEELHFDIVEDEDDYDEDDY